MVRIEKNTNSFIANGKKYLVSGEPLTIARMQKLEEFVLQIQSGYTTAEILKGIEKVIEAFNKGKDVEAKHLLYNIYTSTANIDANMPNPSLLLCTLFILTEGENQAVWVEAEQIEKIKDWELEGIPFADFFELAVSMLPQLMQR